MIWYVRISMTFFKPFVDNDIFLSKCVDTSDTLTTPVNTVETGKNFQLHSNTPCIATKGFLTAQYISHFQNFVTSHWTQFSFFSPAEG